jgi:hypothetical protein
MTTSKALKDFLSDDEILEVLIMFQDRKMDAAKKLALLMFPKWNISTLDAVKILQALQNEIN